MNNLLERLHASFFFYLLVGTTTFMKIGSYLPSVVLVSTAMLFAGMGEWAAARWTRMDVGTEEKEKEEVVGERVDSLTQPRTKWVERPRPILPALLVIAFTHVLGIALFFVCTRTGMLSSGKVSPLPFASHEVIVERLTPGGCTRSFLCRYSFSCAWPQARRHTLSPLEIPM